MRFRPGDRVLVDLERTWGVYVFDPNNASDTDLRPYDLGRDGASGLVTVHVCGPSARSRLNTVRGVVGIPQSQLVEGRTESGSACWFRAADVLAVAP